MPTREVKFYNHIDLPTAKATPSGVRYEPIYELCYDDDGVEFLKDTGEKKDLQAEINSHMGMTYFDLAEAYSRYLNGDADALVIRTGGVYGDFSQITDLLGVVKMNENLSNKISVANQKFTEEQQAEPVSGEVAESSESAEEK